MKSKKPEVYYTISLTVPGNDFEFVVDYDDLVGMCHQIYAHKMGWAGPLSFFEVQEEALFTWSTSKKNQKPPSQQIEEKLRALSTSQKQI